MLFNSLEFITAFLPVTLIGFFLLAAWGGKRAAMFCDSAVRSLLSDPIVGRPP